MELSTYSPGFRSRLSREAYTRLESTLKTLKQEMESEREATLEEVGSRRVSLVPLRLSAVAMSKSGKLVVQVEEVLSQLGREVFVFEPPPVPDDKRVLQAVDEEEP